MRWLRSLFSSAWAGFVILAICVGFLADFPVGRSKLEDSVSTILPIGVALLPYIALGGTVYATGVIGRWALKRILDLLNDGPSVRRFQALATRIQTAQSGIISYLGPSLWSSTYRDTAFASQLITELQLLLEQLTKLGIRVPPSAEINIEERGQLLVAYLARMRTFAERGELHHARQDNFWVDWLNDEDA